MTQNEPSRPGLSALILCVENYNEQIKAAKQSQSLLHSTIDDILQGMAFFDPRCAHVQAGRAVY